MVTKALISSTLILFVITFLAESPCSAEGSLAVGLYPEKVRQGEVCRITVNSNKPLVYVRGDFNGRGINFSSSGSDNKFSAIMGIDMRLNPGTYDLLITANDKNGNTIKRKVSITVLKGVFDVQRLTLPTHMVRFDEETLKRIDSEKEKTSRIWAQETDTHERLWNGQFIMPLEGKMVGEFGFSRIINDENRSPHSGIDLKADQGTPVMAPNSGRVTMVADLFFAGRSIVLDHGQGLYSMYFHLSKQLVVEGKEVKKGDTIGLVGSTGRATGPHLHWGIRLNGARVDPISLIQQTSSF